MTLKQLTDEQVHSMTLEEKDTWWLKNVYRGDMPQLTLRSALSGMIIGGLLSLTNLYVGAKTGWTLGVGITSVILAFSFFKVLSKFNVGNEITLLENNAMQSIATSAGYMTAPLVSSLAAYMMVTGNIIPTWHALIWMILVSILGVLFAFPLKKRFINDSQLPFPEGAAAGVVMANLHADEGKDGMFKAKILAVGAALSATIETLRNHTILEKMKVGFLGIPEHWDGFIYKFFTPAILGTPLKDLTVRWETSIVMMATGGLTGIKVGCSLLLGAIINYIVLAPYLIQEKIIAGPSFKQITIWALWGGVAMMTTSSLYSFFSKPQVLITAFTGLFGKRDGRSKSDVLAHIELPMKLFVIGIPVVGLAVVLTTHAFFNVGYFEAAVAIPLVFVFTLIAVNSTGLTSITPTGALGKLTQLTFAGIAPGNIGTNMIAAGITGEVAGNASNLLMDIKPGYMLGGKPRHQAVGHVLGIFAGAFAAVPVFFLMLGGKTDLLGSETLPMPSAIAWKAVAEVLTNSLDSLHPTARIAVAVGAILGIVIEFFNVRMKGKFPISAMGLGLAFILRFSDALAMALGAMIFWAFEKFSKDETSTVNRVFAQNRETTCAGVIAGGSIIGIVLIILETVVFA